MESKLNQLKQSITAYEKMFDSFRPAGRSLDRVKREIEQAPTAKEYAFRQYQACSRPIAIAK